MSKPSIVRGNIVNNKCNLASLSTLARPGDGISETASSSNFRSDLSVNLQRKRSNKINCQEEEDYEVNSAL
jgi:hypothetical protein